MISADNYKKLHVTSYKMQVTCYKLQVTTLTYHTHSNYLQPEA